MAGRPKSKVFCQSLRRDGKPCLAKGFMCKNNKYLCRFHGFQSTLGFQQPNYTHDSRKRQLRKLKQFKGDINDSSIYSNLSLFSNLLF